MSFIVKRLIRNEDIEDATITGEKIANGTITGEKIADSTITGEKIVDGSISYDKLEPNTILFRIPVPVPDSMQKGLPADAKGVQWTSIFKLKWDKRHLKAVRIRASWTASATDSVTKIAIKDDTTGADIVSVSGNNGTNVEAEATDLSNVTDGGLATIYAEVTTASATTGATFSIEYVIIEYVLGVS